MASAVAEEYLEAIYNMTMEGDHVIGARLAEKFRVARPTVTETIRRLTADGYVVQRADKSIELTPQGQQLTEQVLRRHRLAERMLFDLVGLDWISAHEQAHTLEHGMSDELAQQISERLGHPLTCPHGNPIPGNTSSGMTFLRERRAFRLTQAQPGQTVRVVLVSEVVEDETELLRRLVNKKIHPNARLTVERVDPQAEIAFVAGDETRSISAELAEKIWVALDEPAGDGASPR
jgi:DtxR family Mn-dependent transcriptional regulator